MYFMMWYKPYYMIVIHYNSNIFYVHGFLQRLQNEIKKKSVGQEKNLQLFFTRRCLLRVLIQEMVDI